MRSADAIKANVGSPTTAFDPGTAIAIVGIAVRVPGAADHAAFWRNICAGHDAITDFSDEALLAAGVRATLFGDGDYVRSRGVIDGADCFDATFFGYTPRESALMDPQQRLFLESAWHALEDAGARTAAGARIGVFAGCGMNTYLLNNLAADRDLIRSTDYHQLLLASDKDFLATRVSYKLDLCGPSIAVATACSTSLVAVHLACASIRDGECELALAGGVSIPVPLDEGFVARQDGILARDGRCRPFSAGASGIGAGSGLAIVVLQSLLRAQANGSRIYAVIRGSAINNDGATKAGYTAPSVGGQAAVVGEALAAAGVNPGTIGYVEAHGTGTPLGDPIEIAALTKAYRERGATGNGFCAIGSVKGNIGHLDTAAGAIGLISAALALHHRSIPATLHVDELNPQIDFANSPFVVNTESRPWPDSSEPRRAGVSSFGLGGTNAHVILEEAPAAAAVPVTRPYQVLTVAAKSAPARTDAASRLTAYLSEHPDISAADAAFTLTTRRPFAHRQAIVWSSARTAELVVTGEAPETPPRIVFLFSGGGSEYVGMGRGLYATEPVFRDAFDACATILQTVHGLDLHAAVFPPDGESAAADAALHAPKLAFPALFALEYALVQQWNAWGIRPDAMIGHSLGEYVAAHVAGVFSLEDALALVALRGELFERTPPGAMLRVRLDENALGPILGERLAIAAINAPETCVVSGPSSEIDRFEERLRSDGIDCRRVKLAAAAHSPLVEPLLDEFARFVDGLALERPRLPWISNLSGTWITPDEAISPGYWCRHFRHTVRFSDGLALLFAQPGCILLEVGPGRTLATLALGHPGRTSGHAVHSSLRYREETQPDEVALLGAAAGLWVAGAQPDAAAFHGPGAGRIVSLPGYPFERQTHWIGPERVGRERMSTNGAAHHPSEPQSLARVKAIVAAVSGIPVAGIDESRTFFDLGLDSLALIQVNQALKKQLGVQLGLGELLEDLAQIRALAAHIDGMLGTAPAQPPAPTVALAPSGTLEALIAQQLEIMRTQLELVRTAQAGIPPAAIAPASAVLAAPVPPVKAAVKKPLSFSSETASTARPLRAAQERHLAALIARYTKRTQRSKAYAAQYRDVLADSRAAVGFRLAVKEMQYPIVGVRAAGSRFWDLDDNEYVDLTNGFGVTMFGHHPAYLEAAFADYAGREILFGPRSPLVGEVAELISEMTGMARVSFCNSGTEAVMAAIRLARTRTGRSRIVTFEGAYHGHSDQTLAQSTWRDGRPSAEPIAPGIPPEAVAATIVLEYGTAESLEYVRAHANELAAVLVEPIQNMRLDFQPVEFLHELRAITARAGTALIFDEMITGFRLHPAGAQGYYGIAADIATYGKLIGGGMPIGVVAGSPDYLDGIDGGTWAYGDDTAPQAKRTFFGGTFCQHPLTMIAAAATLRELKAAGPQLQEQLNERTRNLAGTLNAVFERNDLPLKVAHFGSAFRMTVPSNLDLLFYHLIEKGVYVWEWRGCFLSTAHSDRDIEQIVDAVEQSIEELRSGEYIPPRANGASPSFPLTHAQRQLWAIAQLHPAGSLAYKMGLAVMLRGPLNLDRFNTALDTVVARHESLRTAIAPGGEAQVVLPPTAQAANVVDFSGLPSGDREQRIAAWFEAKNGAALALDRDPLFTCHLLRLAADEHVLVLTAHHIVSDGWSLTNLVGELLALYAGRPLEPAMQYRTYADWQRTFAEGVDYARQAAFWREQFAGGIPVLDLPLDRARTPERTYRAQRRSLTLSAELSRSLKRFCAEHGCTPFIGLYATYTALLARWTGQDDLLVGISAGGRALEDSESVFGYCTHVLPVRVRIERRATFAEHLAQTKKTLATAYANADFPFADLLDTLALKRDRSRAPLVAATFNLDKPAAIPAVDGLALELYPHPVHFSDIDLMFNVIDLGETLVLDCDYNSDIFDAASVERLLESYRILLAGAIATPAGGVARLPVAAAAEAASPPHAGGTAAIPESVPVHVQIERQADRRPDAVAVVCGDARLSYAELNRRANQIAHVLRERGVGPDVLVGICLEPALDLVVAVLAVLKAGGAYVPIDPANPPERIALLLEDAHVSVLIAHETQRAQLPVQAGRIDLMLDGDRAAIDERSGANPRVPVRPGQLAYVIYTSGSTGNPKGVLVQHDNLARLFAVTGPAFAFGPEDVWTLFHSAAFDFSVWELFGALVHGGRLVVVPYWIARDSAAFYRLLGTERVTVLNQTPSAFRQLIAAEAASGTHPGLALRTVIFGGEALEIESLRPWFARHGDRAPQLINMYGITETTVHVTYRPLSLADLDGSGSRIGIPLSDLRVELLDAELQPVPRGAAGEIYVGGAGVARGYLNNAALTRERFVEDPGGNGGRLYRSGDRARWTNAGELEFLGRIDDQVKLRGFRIELGEIESALRRHPRVDDAVVALRALESAASQQLIAYVVSSSPAEADGVELRAHLASKLPEYMLPAAFVHIDAVPLTRNGKVDRTALPDPAAPGSADASGERPQTPAEELLTGIWAEVLGREQIGRRENFFEAGGDSIVAMQISARANAAGLALSVRDVHQLPTIAAQAAFAAAAGVRPATVAADADRDAAVLLPAQRWFFGQHQPEPQHHNMALMLEVNAGTSAATLERALAVVASHHAAARTGFRTSPSGWEPFVVPAATVPLIRHDLSGQSAAERAHAMERIGAGVQAGIRLAEPPLWRAVLFTAEDAAASRLLLVFHHLLVDGVSLRILLDDLQTAYRQLAAGEEPRLPVAGSTPQAWAASLEGAVAGGTFEAERSHWLALARGTPLPRDREQLATANRVGTEAHATLQLGRAETAALVGELPRRYQARPDDLVLAALTGALGTWLGDATILIDVEAHGRDLIPGGADVSRTMGWFTSIAPLALEVRAVRPAVATVREVQAARARAPRSGSGYFGSTDLPAAEILFNYLGQFRPAARDGFVSGVVGEGFGAERHANNLRPHLLEVNAYVLDGALTIDITYGTSIHSAATIEALAQRVAAELRDLLEGPASPDTDLGDDQLERVLSALGAD